MTLIILICALIINKLFILFIEGEIGQMCVFRIFARRRIVLIDSKSCKTLVVNVNSPGVHTCYHYINSEIKLKSVNQEWIRNVSANNTTLINWHF